MTRIANERGITEERKAIVIQVFSLFFVKITSFFQETEGVCQSKKCWNLEYKIKKGTVVSNNRSDCRQNRTVSDMVGR